MKKCRLKNDLAVAISETGYTRKKIADIANVSYGSVARILREPENTTIYSLNIVADALGCEVRIIPKGVKLHGAY